MRARCMVLVNGTDISPTLLPVLTSVTVTDGAGKTSATARLEIDDTSGALILPAPKARLEVYLGWDGDGLDRVFEGVVDDIRSRGDRGGGRTLSVSAKEMDTTGKAKAAQSRHWDDKPVSEILKDAAEAAGITELRIDDELASIEIPYIAMHKESFAAFGERVAREVGGTFKIVGTRAVLIPRNGTDAFPTITAAWGVNLHQWDISPYSGRDRYKRSRSRYYDRKAAKWKEVETETDLDDTDVDAAERFDDADEDTAKRKTKGRAKESERNSGDGSVTIEGNTAAQPEATCVVTGARPGVDGTYRIDEVEHSYARDAGFITRITLRRPSGNAGKDTRQ